MRCGSRIVVVTLAGLVAVAPSFAQHAGHEKLGSVNFANTCSPAVQADLSRAMALLHSFWWGATVKAFNEVAQKDPSCGIAHWGVAMAVLENPFGWPPTPKMLADGSAAVGRARAAGAKSQRELDYIAAIETFYKDHDKVEHRTRVVAYEKAMEQLAARYPQDREAAIFYALALNATAVATDKTYAQQLKAAGILEAVFREQPDHPGAAHYLIHSYDYPAIAEKGLVAARRYATIAPSAPHAQHMPSHIFTRRGYWEDSIRSNLASAAAADNDFDRFHAWDYLAYGYLQLGQDRAARGVLDQILSVEKPNVVNFATAFALAAIPSRYALERGQWADAASLALRPADFAWSRFPQAEAILVFGRGLGAARAGNLAAGPRRPGPARGAARRPLAAKVGYWADQVDIQRLVVAGWLARAEGRNDEARPARSRGRGPGRRDREASGHAGIGRAGSRGPRRPPARPRTARRGASRVRSLTAEGPQPPPRLLRGGARGGARRRQGEGAGAVRERRDAHREGGYRAAGGRAGQGISGEALTGAPAYRRAA